MQSNCDDQNGSDKKVTKKSGGGAQGCGCQMGWRSPAINNIMHAISMITCPDNIVYDHADCYSAYDDGLALAFASREEIAAFLAGTCEGLAQMQLYNIEHRELI